MSVLSCNLSDNQSRLNVHDGENHARTGRSATACTLTHLEWKACVPCKNPQEQGRARSTALEYIHSLNGHLPARQPARKPARQTDGLKPPEFPSCASLKIPYSWYADGSIRVLTWINLYQFIVFPNNIVMCLNMYVVPFVHLNLCVNSGRYFLPLLLWYPCRRCDYD